TGQKGDAVVQVDRRLLELLEATERNVLDSGATHRDRLALERGSPLARDRTRWTHLRGWETGARTAGRVRCLTVEQVAIRAAYLVDLGHSRAVVGGCPVAAEARDVAALLRDAFSGLLGNRSRPLRGVHAA